MNRKAYKLFRIKEGKLYPLFINRNKETVLGQWLEAECIPTKGFAVRKGWHCCFSPIAPHLKTELKNGEKRVWVECEVKDFETYSRPESQGGEWILANSLKVNRILSSEEVEVIKERKFDYEAINPIKVSDITSEIVRDSTVIPKIELKNFLVYNDKKS